MKRRKKFKIKRLFKLILILIIIISSLFFIKPLLSKKESNDNNNYNNVEEKEDLEENKTSVNEFLNSLDTYDKASVLNYEEGTALERLEYFSTKDNRIKTIIDKYDSYPEPLMEALSRNIELTDYVLNYNDKKGHVYSEDIGKVTKGVIPKLYQWDERWGYGDYGNSNIAVSGCGPTSLAMVIAALTGDNSITPYKIAQVAVEKGYYLNSSGTTWDLMSKGAPYFGLKVNELPLSKQSIKNALNNNHPVILSMRKGDFTINGHYIVVAGIKDDKLIINDPNSKVRSSLLWDYNRIESQIKNLWEFYL